MVLVLSENDLNDVWRITWPPELRGTHPMVGVATGDCPLTEASYKRLVGSTSNSWGWCLKSLKIYHDSHTSCHTSWTLLEPEKWMKME